MMLRGLCGSLLAVMLLMVQVAAAKTLLIAHPAARAGESLNGDWRVIVDPAKVGSISPFEGFPPVAFQTAKPWSDDLVLQEWAFDPKVTLRVPGDWNSQAERLFFYQGDVWYARPITLTPQPGERLFVHFGAVNYRADVWLNGQPLGSHEGGFTPFAFEISEKAKAGENMLVVRVRSELGRTSVPTEHTDWLNYGGITRDVRLVRTPALFVRDYFVRLLDHKSRQVAADVYVEGAPSGTLVQVSLPGLSEKAVGRTDAAGVARLSWRTRAALWSPKTPTLHAVEIRVGTDVVTDRIGLRTVAVRGEDILLNGKPIFLRGVSAHEEAIGRPGRSFGAEDARATLQLIQRLNGNFIRLAHYPHDEATTRMADEMGILVWAEMPLYWGIAWTNADTLANAKAQSRAMVERDRNRASVILWSIANETPKTDDRLKFLSDIASEMRAADPTRPLTAALFGDPLRYAQQLARIIAARLIGMDSTPEAQRVDLRRYLERAFGAAQSDAQIAALSEMRPAITIDDPLANVIDVIGFNQYVGWYYEAPISRLIPASEAQVRRVSLDLMAVTDIRSVARKPLMFSEFGADAKAGHRGADTQIFTEDFQADYYRRQIAMIAGIPNLRGVSPWVLKDFRAPRRTLPHYQDYWNRKGLVDENGVPKLAFDVLEAAYAPSGVFGLRDGSQ
jgi:beta-glucuronidase